MNNQTHELLKKHYLAACYSAVIAGALGVVLYPSEHGIASVGRGVVLIIAFIAVGLFGMVVSRAVKEKELDKTQEGESAPEAMARFKKMGLLWYGLAALLSSTLLRIPGVKWFRGAESLNRVDQVSLAVGAIVFSLVVLKFISLARVSLRD